MLVEENTIEMSILSEALVEKETTANTIDFMVEQQVQPPKVKTESVSSFFFLLCYFTL